MYNKTSPVPTDEVKKKRKTEKKALVVTSRKNVSIKVEIKKFENQEV